MALTDRRLVKPVVGSVSAIRGLGHRTIVRASAVNKNEAAGIRSVRRNSNRRHRPGSTAAAADLDGDRIVRRSSTTVRPKHSITMHLRRNTTVLRLHRITVLRRVRRMAVVATPGLVEVAEMAAVVATVAAKQD